MLFLEEIRLSHQVYCKKRMICALTGNTEKLSINHFLVQEGTRWIGRQ